MSYLANLDFSGKENYQWPGPGELLFMSQVIGERPKSAPGADGINSSSYTPQGFSGRELPNRQGRRGRGWVQEEPMERRWGEEKESSHL